MADGPKSEIDGSAVHTRRVTPEQFGAKPDGVNRHGAIADMFAYLDSKGGGRVVLSPGTYVFNGGITINSPVTITGTGTLRVEGSATYALKIAGDYSRIESGVTVERGSRPLTITADHVFVDATVRNAGSYGFDISGDYCTVGNNAKAYNAGYAGMRLVTSRPLNRFDIGRFESINHRYKGFVYNGTGGVKEINIGSLYAVTNTTDQGSAGLLIDAGGSESSGIVYVGTLRIGEMHLEGHTSNGFKIYHTRRVEIGKVYQRNAASGISSSSGAGLYANGIADSYISIGEWNSDHRLRSNFQTLEIGKVTLVGNRAAAMELGVGGYSGYTAVVGDVYAKGRTSDPVIIVDGRPKKVTVRRIISSAPTFGSVKGTLPRSVTVEEKIEPSERHSKSGSSRASARRD